MDGQAIIASTWVGRLLQERRRLKRAAAIARLESGRALLRSLRRQPARLPAEAQAPTTFDDEFATLVATLTEGRLLDPPVLAQIDRMAIAVRSSRAGGTVTPEVDAALAALERCIDLEWARLTGLDRLDSPAQPATAAAAAETGFTPSEATLLGQLAEKFYGSWTFRFVAGMLVAAGLLAVGGQYIVGRDTIAFRRGAEEARLALEATARQTRLDVEAAQQRAADELARRVLTAQQEISEHQARLAGVRREFDLRRAETEQQLEQTVQGFRDSMQRLSQAAADSARADLRARAEGEIGRVVTAVRNALAEAGQRELAAITQHSAEIRAEAERARATNTTLAQEIGQLRVEVGARQAEQAALARDLDALRSLSQERAALTEAARVIREMAEATRRAQQEAAADAATAGRARSAAEAEGQRAAALLSTLLAGVSDQERRLGGLGERLSQLDNDLQRRQRQMGAAVSTAPARLAETEAQLRALSATATAQSARLEALDRSATELREALTAQQQRWDTTEPALRASFEAELRILREARLAERVAVLERTGAAAPAVVPVALPAGAAAGPPPSAPFVPEEPYWRVVQDRLRAEGGFDADPDGVPGRRTEEAVRRFQTARGLTPDGSFGPGTAARMGVVNPPQPMTVAYWRAVQARLKAAGFYNAAIDGTRGAPADAIRAFQQRFNVPVTGEMDAPTARQLGIDLPPTVPIPPPAAPPANRPRTAQVR